MYGYIYKTTNLINNKIYVGQHKAKQFEPEKYIGSEKLLKKAINKYGKINFICELIEECNSEQELNEKEIYWISFYSSNVMEYNISSGGFVPRLSGIHNPMFGVHRFGKNNPFYGKKHTKETKKRLSETHKGKGHKHTSEEIEKIRIAHRNIIMSEETKKKISETNKLKLKNGTGHLPTGGGFKKGYIPWNKGIKWKKKKSKCSEIIN